MPRFYTTTHLSEHLAETPEGYLLCSDVPITRTGEFIYKASEMVLNGKQLVEPDDNGLVRILRDEKEVFSDTAIRSFEGKSFTLNHPEGFVKPDNWQELTHGTIQNVHRGDSDSSDLMLCDILVTTEDGIKLIKAGERELSCGYDAEYEALGKGLGRQYAIVGNHVALVPKGRAGSRCSIQDRACTGCNNCKCGKNKDQEAESMDKEKLKEGIVNFLGSLGMKVKVTDAEAEETEEEKKKRLEEEEKKEKEMKDKKTKDADEKMSQLEERLSRIEDMLAELLSEEESEETEDADETEEEKAEREKKEAEEKKTKDAEEAKAKEEEEKKKEAEEKKEEKATTDAWPTVLSHIEILTPGVQYEAPKNKLTMDSIKSEVLLAVMKDQEYGKKIEEFLAGHDVKKLTGDALDVAFLGASAMMTSLRNKKAVGIPIFPKITKDSSGEIIRKINEQNKAFHKDK